MTIRPARPHDREGIAAIQAASPEASHWDPAGYPCHVAVVLDERTGDERVAGFLVARAASPDEHEVLNLAVDPRYRRRGIGRALVEHVIQASPGTWFLEVRVSNQGARKLYECVGFQATGTRANYYRNPPESAIVMRLQS